uniref:Uncharacterized protein n=1 Tax=Arundo donax TaxID=35708 RepID=A0A0A9CZ44_ARUDO
MGVSWLVSGSQLLYLCSGSAPRRSGSVSGGGREREE